MQKAVAATAALLLGGGGVVLRRRFRRPTPELEELRAEPSVRVAPTLSRWLDRVDEHPGRRRSTGVREASRTMFARPIDPARRDDAFAELVQMILASDRWDLHRVLIPSAALTEPQPGRGWFERQTPDFAHNVELAIDGSGRPDDPELIVVRLSLRPTD